MFLQDQKYLYNEIFKIYFGASLSLRFMKQ